MGWFIAQSLAFIIIAALIGLAIGIWIGWLVWGRRSKGKHAAEKAEAARLAAAESGSAARNKKAAKAKADDAETEQAEAVPAVAAAAAAGADESDKSDAATAVLPVADGASASDAEPVPAEGDSTSEAEAEVEAAKSAVVAEAEAVARKAAEADAAAKAAAEVEAGENGAEAENTSEAVSETEDSAEKADAEAGSVEAAPADTAPADSEAPDDLRRIEGVGPKIASALVAAGYGTYAKIADATEDELREAVAGQGIKFAPAAASWADQAKYLVDSDTDGLAEYQDYLVGGQERRAKFDENVDYADVDEIEGAEAKAAAIAEDEAEAAAAAPEAGVAEPEVAAEPEPEPQDLRRIEGIGPKIEATLQAAGFTTYAKVAAASETELREALASGGIKFAPAATSWADQAQFLADGDEAGLQEFQDYLIGGQDRAAKFKESVDYTDVDEIEDADAKAAALAADEAKAASADDGAEPTGSEVKA